MRKFVNALLDLQAIDILMDALEDFDEHLAYPKGDPKIDRVHGIWKSLNTAAELLGDPPPAANDNTPFSGGELEALIRAARSLN